MHPECIVTSLPTASIVITCAEKPRGRLTAKTDSGLNAAGPKRDAAVAAAAERSEKGTGLSVSRLPIRFNQPESGYKSGPTRTLETADLS